MGNNVINSFQRDAYIGPTLASPNLTRRLRQTSGASQLVLVNLHGKSIRLTQMLINDAWLYNTAAHCSRRHLKIYSEGRSVFFSGVAFLNFKDRFRFKITTVL